MATKTELREKLTQLQTAKTNAFKMDEAERLLLELQVHQVELEMQNQDLRETQQALEDSRDRYADLYDFAPVGYVSLTGQGVIQELNLTAATLLGKPRQRLLNYPFARFVAKTERHHFFSHVQHCQTEGWARTELTLLSKNGFPHQVQLYSTQVQDQTHGSLCRTVITDITDLKQAEDALRQAQVELEQRVQARTAELQAANEALQQEIQRRQQEIAERKAVEEALRQSEALYHTIARNIPGGVVALVDRELRFLIADGPELATLGLTQEGVKGHTVGEVFSEKIRPLAEARYRQALAGETSSYEYHFRGRVLWTQFVPLHDESGTVIAAMSLSLGITERQRAEEALRQSREDLDRAQAVGQIGWWRLDTRQNVLTWSPENHRIFGVPEGTPMSYEFFLSLVHPDDRQYVDTQWQAGLRGEPYDIEHRLVADGKVKWVREKAYLEFDGEGQLLGGFGITQDITARKEAEEALRASEEKYRNLFENMAEEVHFWQLVRDEAGHIKTWRLVDVNPPALKTWGRQSAEEVRGKTIDEIFGPAATEHYRPVVQELFTAGVPYAFEDYFPNLDKHFRFTSVPFGEYFITTGADITPIKKAQEALRRSEARWNAAIESFAEGAIIATEDEQVIYWNPAAREMHGFTRPDEGIEPLEKTSIMFQLWTPDGRHQLELDEWPIRRIQRGETIRHLELRLRRLDQGWEKVFSYSGARVATAGGERLIFLTCHDLTELRKAEQALRQSERRYRSFIEVTNEWAWVTNPAGLVVEDIPALRAFTGQTYEQARGAGWADALHPGDVQRTLEVWNRAVSTKTLYKTEYRMQRHDGTYRLLLARGVPILDDQGSVIEWVGTCIDITERKQAEEALRESEARLRAIVHAVPDVLLVLDEEGRYLEILSTQPQFLDPEPTTLKGRLVSDVLPAEIAQVSLNAIRQTLLTRQPQRFEYALPTGGAGQHYLEARTAPMDGLFMGRAAVVQLVRDVTSQRLTEASLRQAQKMEAVGQLTGGMAHDFNNLLAVILGNLELLAEDLTEVPLADLVHRAQGATERGAELIRRLLAFARKQPLQVKAVDLNRLVTGMRELLQRTLGETIQIETRLAADLAQTVIDSGQLETALLNVAINARDAMPTGGRLTIETANSTLAEDDPRTQGYQVSPGPYVLLTISDTGCGMPPAVVEHAVEPFFTTKEAGQGSGLGLSMVYGLIKQSGGHLQLYSEVGQGTTLRIYLPAVPRAPDSPRATAHPEAPLPTGQGQLILVVEDEASVRRLTVHLLQSLGYQTVEAETAASALVVLAANPQVAVLFTDVVLPGGKSGVDLAQEACQQRPGLKVLFTSGYTEAHLTRFTHPLVGSELLSKPYRKAQLANQLHALFHNKPSGGD